MPKKINPELRARAVRMVQEHQQDYPSQTAAAQAVARQLGLGRETVRRWVVSAEIDAGGRPGATSAELAEIKTLKAKVRRLEEDNAILSDAWPGFAHFFAASALRWWLVVRCAAPARRPRAHGQVA